MKPNNAMSAVVIVAQACLVATSAAHAAPKYVPLEYIGKDLMFIETQVVDYPNGGAPQLRAYFNLWQALDWY